MQFFGAVGTSVIIMTVNRMRYIDFVKFNLQAKNFDLFYRDERVPPFFRMRN